MAQWIQEVDSRSGFTELTSSHAVRRAISKQDREHLLREHGTPPTPHRLNACTTVTLHRGLTDQAGLAECGCCAALRFLVSAATFGQIPAP
jgi:hypothetical protein